MSALRGAGRRTAWTVSAALLVGTLAACSGSAGTADPGPGAAASSSAATAPPAGSTETASSPGGTPTRDAEPTDAEPTDAEETGDAGPTDAGPTDAGPTDAGPTDAVTDAPVEVDPASRHSVVLSFATVGPDGSAVEASGSVPGLIEDGGRCVLVLSLPGRADVTAEGEAFADAQSTSCGLLTVPLDRLSAGTWTARLDYRSDASSGSSDGVGVVVP